MKFLHSQNQQFLVIGVFNTTEKYQRKPDPIKTKTNNSPQCYLRHHHHHQWADREITMITTRNSLKTLHLHQLFFHSNPFALPNHSWSKNNSNGTLFTVCLFLHHFSPTTPSTHHLPPFWTTPPVSPNGLCRSYPDWTIIEPPLQNFLRRNNLQSNITHCPWLCRACSNCRLPHMAIPHFVFKFSPTTTTTKKKNYHHPLTRPIHPIQQQQQHWLISPIGARIVYHVMNNCWSNKCNCSFICTDLNKRNDSYNISMKTWRRRRTVMTQR